MGWGGGEGGGVDVPFYFYPVFGKQRDRVILERNIITAS